MPDTLRIIPLGGVGEVGKNITVIECDDEILVVDCGLAFPDPDMLGIDLVIPDVTYLAERRERVRGIVLTHGHEDHTGALPYVLPQLPGTPIYATRLTEGLVQGKLREHKLHESTPLHVVEPGREFAVGTFSVTPFRVNHSIPDGVGFAIRTTLISSSTTRHPTVDEPTLGCWPRSGTGASSSCCPTRREPRRRATRCRRRPSATACIGWWARRPAESSWRPSPATSVASSR